jgi:ABC-2 type transport system permease protein
MLPLIQIELSKIFRKWRTYIGFLALLLLVGIIQTVMFFEGQNYLDYLTKDLSQSFYFVGNLLNGYFVAHLILNYLTIHIPFLIVLVTGDLLAGESTAGTYRMLLTRPVSRFQLITAKFLSGIIYTILIVSWLAILSLGLGVLLFGTGELIVFKSSIIVIAHDDLLWRFIYAFGFAMLSMSVVASLGFFFSSLVENAIGPIISTMVVIIIFTILSSLDLDVLKNIRPYLFTNYILDWKLLFEDPVDFHQLYKSVLILLEHIIGLYGITLYLFYRKDILS